VLGDGSIQARALPGDRLAREVGLGGDVVPEHRIESGPLFEELGGRVTFLRDVESGRAAISMLSVATAASGSSRT
jgi:hypothetical protein